MIDRFSRPPAHLAERTRTARLGRSGVPALLAHPDWRHPAPVMLWMHGRTASKELDPGRYLRWIRAGIAACAIDLPGHGERAEPAMQEPARTLDVLERVLPEIDEVLDALADPRWGGAFDLDRAGIGGMSAGGMAALRRLGDPHPFRCAAVESTTGALRSLYLGGSSPSAVRHDPARVARLDSSAHLDAWRPIPLLALHNEDDRVVPVGVAREFVELLREVYRGRGAPADAIEFVTWRRSGAPEEHAGFGRYANDAKTKQAEFLARHLLPIA